MADTGFGNILELIAKGPTNNLFGSLMEGYGIGAKRKLAQQEQDAIEKYRQQNLDAQAAQNAAENQYRNNSLAEQSWYHKQSLANERARIEANKDPFANRAAAAIKYGMTPGTPEFQSYVLTNDLTPGGGGGSVSGEILGRIGMGDRFLKRLPDIEKRMEAIYGPNGQNTALNAASRAKQYMGYGEGAALERDVASGADALIRMMTGSGMHEQEARGYANRYNPQPGDTYEQMKQKVANLKGDLEASRAAIVAGKHINLGDLPGNEMGLGGSVGGVPVSPKDEARALIQRMPQARDEIIQRLKANNIDTSGL